MQVAAAAAARAASSSSKASVRHFSKHVARDARVLSQFDSGFGGYSSNKGITATVFGATGFVGRYVVDKLASKGITVIVPFRGDDLEARHLKLMGDLGRVNPVPYDPRVVDSVRDVVHPSQLVVNLIGKDFETKHWAGSFVKNYTYEQVHAEIPRMLAQVCAEQGVHQFIHMSSLAARPGSLSELDTSKLNGEIAVRAHFPDATIVKPANIFGDEDRFMNQIARLARALPSFALVNNGTAQVQPVYVNDVAKAVVNMVQSPDAVGATYNLAGPDVLTRKELTEFVFDVIRRPPTVVDLPISLLQGIGKFVEQFPGPYFTADQVVQQLSDNIIEAGEENHLADLLVRLDFIVFLPFHPHCGSGSNTYNRLIHFVFSCMQGEDPTSIHHASYRFLHQYRLGGHFMETA